MNKKAIVFTFISIMIAGLLSLMFSTNQITPLDSDIRLEETKVLSANNYLQNLNLYLENALEVSGYAAFQGMIENIWITDTYYANEADIYNSFEECILNGTLESGLEVCPFMENQTITYLTEKIVNISRSELNMDINVSIKNAWINQTGPFITEVHLITDIVLRDRDILWNQTDREIITDISIHGLTDPLYFKLGIYNSTFKETLFKRPAFNTTNFEIFLNNSEYIVSQQKNVSGKVSGQPTVRSMSFFGRLADNYDVYKDSRLTIISVVNPEKLVAAGTPEFVENRSYIDYLFLNEINIYCSSLKFVADTGNKAPIDTAHAFIDFNLTGLELEDTC